MSTKELKINTVGLVETGVKVTDAASMAAIFGMFLGQVTLKLLEESLKYVLFFIPLIASTAEAAFIWYQGWLEKWKDKNTILKGIIYSLVAPVLGLGVIGALFLKATILGALAPFLFVAAIVTKTLFHLASGLYYGALAIFNPEQRKENAIKAGNHLLAAFIGAILAPAVTFVFVLLKAKLAIIGVVGASLAVGVGIYKGYQSYKKRQTLKGDANTSDLTASHSSDALLAQRMSAKPGARPAQQVTATAGSVNDRQAAIVRLSRSKYSAGYFRKADEGTALLTKDERKQIRHQHLRASAML